MQRSRILRRDQCVAAVKSHPADAEYYHLPRRGSYECGGDIHGNEHDLYAGATVQLQSGERDLAGGAELHEHLQQRDEHNIFWQAGADLRAECFPARQPATTALMATGSSDTLAH